MNRTDRLYAMVEELRATPAGSRTAKELADVFEVSVRTVERDILALQEAGVPIRGVQGRRGGYVLDRERTLPPTNFTPAEAMAVAVALAGDVGPFAAAGRSARNKLLAAMSADDRNETRSLAARLRRFRSPDEVAGSVDAVVQRAIVEQLVLRLGYADRNGNVTTRDVEPIGVVSLDDAWFLVGWCRLRDGVRSFRLDRIASSELTGDRATPRDPSRFIEDIPWADERPDVLS